MTTKTKVLTITTITPIGAARVLLLVPEWLWECSIFSPVVIVNTFDASVVGAV